MINLIKNEWIKVFKKKSIYIAMIVVLVFIIACNCIIKYSTQTGYYYTQRIGSLEEMLATLDPENPSDTSMYLDIKTELDQSKLVEKYGEDSWQATIIQDRMREVILQKNTYQHGATKNEQLYQEAEKKYNEYLQRLENNDWTYFAKQELEQLNTQIADIQKQKSNTVDKSALKEMESNIESLELQKQIVSWRLEKDISYARSDLNTALYMYSSAQNQVRQYESNPPTDHSQKLDYQDAKERAGLAKYTIENKVIVNKSDDARGMILNFFNSYGIFIIAIGIMIAGTIISEEFSKGTIKLLLVRPYKRWKILLAKFITCILALVLITVLVAVAQFVIGGIVFGLDSLSTPAVYYDFNTNQVQTMNLFAYVGLQGLSILPMAILLLTIAFMLATIFTNSAFAIVIALLGYMSTSIINMMALQLNLTFMKFFITLNWDFNAFLFGGISTFPFTTFAFSAIMCILYFIVMLAISFVAFNKKNIKNI